MQEKLAWDTSRMLSQGYKKCPYMKVLLLKNTKTHRYIRPNLTTTPELCSLCPMPAADCQDNNKPNF